MEKPIYDYSKLRGKIKEVYGTETEFSKATNLSAVSISSRLNNKTNFDQPEMDLICDLLGIKDSDRHSYFFTKELKKT